MRFGQIKVWPNWFLQPCSFGEIRPSPVLPDDLGSLQTGVELMTYGLAIRTTSV